jgi:phosphatidate cytidylyltransferase
MWWALTVFPAMACADGGAFFLGGAFGRHPMAARTSPKKTWEGYLGGVLSGTLFAWLFASLWHLAEPSFVPLHGMLVGLAVTSLAPLGDLAESMFKRELNVKDTSKIFPGHGGMMDRIDTLLYVAVIGYYLIRLLG